jgi:acyl-coenzyme A thioesterase PaaI-like protein
MGKDMDRWLGDGGMLVIEAIGGSIDEYGDGWCKGTWTPTKMACNPHDIVQAGVYGVMLDAAMNFAINASLDGKDRTKATLEMKTDCMKDTLTISGKLDRMTKLIAFSSAEIRNEKDEVICRSSGTFMIHRADA